METFWEEVRKIYEAETRRILDSFRIPYEVDPSGKIAILGPDGKRVGEAIFHPPGLLVVKRLSDGKSKGFLLRRMAASQEAFMLRLYAFLWLEMDPPSG